MIVTTARAAKGIKHLQKLGAPVPPGFYDMTAARIASYCNGIGSDDPSTKWLVAPTSFIFAWMFDASIPHDIWWSELYNDGSRKRFETSNEGFRETLDLIAEESLPWVWPSALRRDLRNGRHWQADKAYQILMSDKCWEIWQKNAEIEPGPETTEVPR